MIILGIDPGLSVTGYGVVAVDGGKARCVDFGGIYPASRAPLAEKLQRIYAGIKEVVEAYHPDAVAIEDIFYHENVKTAIVMGHARGVSILAAQQAQVPVFEYSPREVKMSVGGSGAASKQQVQAMVQTLLRLPELPRPFDAADALAVALCHFHRMKFQSLTSAAR